MDPKTIKSISAQIYRQFPEMSGIAPKVRARPVPESQRAFKKPAAPTYLLNYQTKAALPEGKSISRWVRVVVDAQGKIIKITTSH
ncbi:MAG: hypothetical protein EHM70_00895 [Chloroflexota bacterium]|nr:MAG: hypothetical protein EHM70_00895 [Chloroflexota bacterium]